MHLISLGRSGMYRSSSTRRATAARSCSQAALSPAAVISLDRSGTARCGCEACDEAAPGPSGICLSRSLADKAAFHPGRQHQSVLAERGDQLGSFAWESIRRSRRHGSASGLHMTAVVTRPAIVRKWLTQRNREPIHGRRARRGPATHRSTVASRTGRRGGHQCSDEQRRRSGFPALDRHLRAVGHTAAARRPFSGGRGRRGPSAEPRDHRCRRHGRDGGFDGRTAADVRARSGNWTISRG